MKLKEACATTIIGEGRLPSSQNCLEFSTPKLDSYYYSAAFFYFDSEAIRFFRGVEMTKRFIVLLAAATALTGTAHAQTVQTAPAQALVVGGETQPILRSGTEIPVSTRTELTTEHKALHVGQRFEVETTEPVLLNGQVVIPVGTTGVGEITMVRNKGMWGKSGHFACRLLYLRVGDRQIKLSGTIDDKGSAGGVGAVAVSAIVFAPAGFFMTGTSARLPAGTIIKGFLEEDVPVAFAATPAPAPIVVPIPQAPPAAPIQAVPVAAAPAQAVMTPAVAVVPTAEPAAPAASEPAPARKHRKSGR